MNHLLMRISLVVAILVNITLAGTVFYQNRGIIPSNDRQVQIVVSQLDTKVKAYEAKLKDYEARIKAYADRTNKFETAGAKVDQEIQWLKAQLKKIVQ